MHTCIVVCLKFSLEKITCTRIKTTDDTTTSVSIQVFEIYPNPGTCGHISITRNQDQESDQLQVSQTWKQNNGEIFMRLAVSGPGPRNKFHSRCTDLD